MAIPYFNTFYSYYFRYSAMAPNYFNTYLFLAIIMMLF